MSLGDETVGAEARPQVGLRHRCRFQQDLDPQTVQPADVFPELRLIARCQDDQTRPLREYPRHGVEEGGAAAVELHAEGRATEAVDPQDGRGRRRRVERQLEVEHAPGAGPRGGDGNRGIGGCRWRKADDVEISHGYGIQYQTRTLSQRIIGRNRTSHTGRCPVAILA